ncbi:hypothetical protein PHJA_002910700 [Phtheirospermum japonicum]|uniref:Uncharacterized protein n=1 Tax=Phtheirospermum japonicum TaxID=374723 RepID=A0A830DLN6_9LAMI|nr:hypothetical protein PHJA_002910700 [Phtheirospermum japonicum]
MATSPLKEVRSSLGEASSYTGNGNPKMGTRLLSYLFIGGPTPGPPDLGSVCRLISLIYTHMCTTPSNHRHQQAGGIGQRGGSRSEKGEQRPWGALVAVYEMVDCFLVNIRGALLAVYEMVDCFLDYMVCIKKLQEYLDKTHFIMGLYGMLVKATGFGGLARRRSANSPPSTLPSNTFSSTSSRTNGVKLQFKAKPTIEHTESSESLKFEIEIVSVHCSFRFLSIRLDEPAGWPIDRGPAVMDCGLNPRRASADWAGLARLTMLIAVALRAGMWRRTICYYMTLAQETVVLEEDSNKRFENFENCPVSLKSSRFMSSKYRRFENCHIKNRLKKLFEFFTTSSSPLHSTITTAAINIISVFNIPRCKEVGELNDFFGEVGELVGGVATWSMRMSSHIGSRPLMFVIGDRARSWDLSGEVARRIVEGLVDR